MKAKGTQSQRWGPEQPSLGWGADCWPLFLLSTPPLLTSGSPAQVWDESTGLEAEEDTGWGLAFGIPRKGGDSPPRSGLGWMG